MQQFKLTVQYGFLAFMLLCLFVNGNALRIVSLSPNITEMLFAIGAGQQIVAVDSASDSPKQVSTLPVVATFEHVNIEKIIALKADIVIAWPIVMQQQQLSILKKFGIRVYYQQPKKISDIATNLIQLGQWTSHTIQAKQQVKQFTQQLQQIKKYYHNQKNIKVFYQIQQQPLLTVNQNSSVGQVLQLCHANNIFAELPSMNSGVGLEQVIKQKPKVIIVQDSQSVKFWRKWLPKANIIINNDSQLQRYTPKLLTAAAHLCKQLRIDVKPSCSKLKGKCYNYVAGSGNN